MKNLKIISLFVVSIFAISTVVYAFSDNDAKKIANISKEMSDISEDINLSQLKLKNLVDDRNLLNEKIRLVENHINEQNKLIDSYKNDIAGIIGFQKTEK